MESDREEENHICFTIPHNRENACENNRVDFRVICTTHTGTQCTALISHSSVLWSFLFPKFSAVKQIDMEKGISNFLFMFRALSSY